MYWCVEYKGAFLDLSTTHHHHSPKEGRKESCFVFSLAYEGMKKAEVRSTSFELQGTASLSPGSQGVLSR